MGRAICNWSSRERVGPWRLTEPRAMVVWRPSVSRTVKLHTGTLGVHRACFRRSAAESHSPASRSHPEPFYLSFAPSLYARTNWRALGVFGPSGTETPSPEVIETLLHKMA